ncbi:MAG: aminoacyl-tRNA hydrolase [Patescibacteria group bacterium]
MTIIIGIGNPGEKYKNTRHNIGFMVLDKFAEKNNFPEFSLQKKYGAETSEMQLGEQKVLLAKPKTFMNNSGKSAQKLVKSDLTNLIIVHDDVDLPIGKIKIVKNRGSAGHKGVESIIKAIGNENLIRVRIGIGGNSGQFRALNHGTKKAGNIVLKKFSKNEQKNLDQTLAETADALDFLIKQGLDKAMNEYNK